MIGDYTGMQSGMQDIQKYVEYISMCIFVCCQLSSHIQLHLNLREFVCAQCTKRFNQQIHLSQHILRVHGSSRYISNYFCTLPWGLCYHAGYRLLTSLLAARISRVVASFFIADCTVGTVDSCNCYCQLLVYSCNCWWRKKLCLCHP